MKHHVIYIPGLGDTYDRFRRRALPLWSLFGVSTHLVPMQWYNDESYDVKYQRASELISELAYSGANVSLVGESAGASMAINLFANHPQVTKLVTIAGVNSSTAPVSAHTLRRAPAFDGSKKAVNDSLSRVPPNRLQHVHTVSAWVDHIVSPNYSYIAGANNHRIASFGHVLTVAFCLTIYSWYVVALTKK